MSDYYHDTQKGINNPETSNLLPDYIRVIITTDSHGRKRQLLIPAALELDRPKKPRTTFRQYQIEAMEREFQRNPFISEERRATLASILGITETQVKVWFQNRRTKARKLDVNGHGTATGEM